MGINAPLTQNLMPNKTFFWFFLPTGLAMILFIGLPIISTGIQSFYAQHDQVVKEVKKCDPFGCTVSIVVDNEETTKLREAKIKTKISHMFYGESPKIHFLEQFCH